MQKNQHTKADIRRTMRLERAKLSATTQTEKADLLLSIVTQLPIFIQSQTIAAYWPNDNEINPLSILEKAETLGKSCYLPKISKNSASQLQFVEYQSQDSLVPNQFGILEPLQKDRKLISPESLDLVLVPLVAFDKTGQRLGMGKGYYDHTFAFHKTTSHAKPFLLGIAYDLQSVPKLPFDEWDVPLDAIATETHYIYLKEHT